MKKNKFALLLISAAMAAGLASCGNSTPAGSNDGSTGSGSQGSQTSQTSAASKTGVITLSEERPTEVAIGDCIDLDQYVTVTLDGAPGTFSVSTKYDTIRIEGHKVYGVARGYFTVVISVDGSDSKPKAYVGNVISANKAAMNRWLDTIGNNYTATMSFATDDTTVSEDFVGVWTTAIHNESYWYNNSYGMGFIHLADGNWYEIGYDDDDNLVVNPGPKDIENYYMTMDFPFAGDDFVEEQDEEGNWYNDVTISMSKTFQQDLYKVVGVEPNEFDESSVGFTLNDFDITSARAYFDEEAESLKIDLYKTVDGAQVNSGFSVSIGSVGTTEDAELKAYIDSGAIPDAIKAEELATYFGNIATAKNVTIGVNAWWNDGQGNSITNPASNGWEDLLFDYDYTTYMDGATYYEKNNDDGSVLALATNPNDVTDESAYIVKGTKGDNEAMTWTSTATSKITPTDIWAVYGVNADADMINAQTYSDKQTTTIGDVTYTDYTLSTAENEATDKSIELSYTDGSTETITVNNLIYSFFCLTPLSEGFSTEYAYYQWKYDFFSCDIVTNGTEVTVDLGLAWTSGQYYDIVISFSDIGATAVPTDYQSAFTVEA